MSKKLLVADDSNTIREMVRLTFLNTDVEVLAAEDGQSAIDLAKTSSPDLILADVNMPRMDGYDVCRSIRSEAELAKIPLLLFTGLESEPDEELASAVGAQGYAYKPYDTEQLIELVNRHAGQWVGDVSTGEGSAELQAQDELEDIEILELDENDIEMIEDDSGDLDIQPIEAAEAQPAPKKSEEDFDFMGALDDAAPEPEPTPEPVLEPEPEPEPELDLEPVLETEPEPELELEPQPELEPIPEAEIAPEVAETLQAKVSTEPFATEIPEAPTPELEAAEVVDEVLDYVTEIPGGADEALDYSEGETPSSAGMDYSSIDALLDEIPQEKAAPEAPEITEEKPAELPPMTIDDLDEDKPEEFETIPSAEIIMDDEEAPAEIDEAEPVEEPELELEPVIMDEPEDAIEPEPIEEEPAAEPVTELEPITLDEPKDVIEPEPIEELAQEEMKAEEEFETIPADDLDLIPEDASTQEAIEPKITDDVVDLLSEPLEVSEEPEEAVEPVDMEVEPVAMGVQAEIPTEELEPQEDIDELAVEPIEPSDEFEVTNVKEHPKAEPPLPVAQTVDFERLKEVVANAVQEQVTGALENLLPGLLQQALESTGMPQLSEIEEKITSGLSSVAEKAAEPVTALQEHLERLSETQQGLKESLEQVQSDVSERLKTLEDSLAEKLAPLEEFPGKFNDRFDMMNDKLGVVGQQISGLHFEVPEIDFAPVTDELAQLKQRSEALETSLATLGEKLGTVQDELSTTMQEKFAVLENAEPQPSGASEDFIAQKFETLSEVLSSRLETLQSTTAETSAEVDLSEIHNEFGTLRALVEEKAIATQVPVESGKKESVREELMKFARWMDMRLKKLPAASGAAAGGGVDTETLRAALREELGSMMGERVDAVVWEVVPDLVDTILKNELAKRDG